MSSNLISTTGSVFQDSSSQINEDTHGNEIGAEVVTFECPDVHSSTAAYASRFSGAIGSWLLSVQELIAREVLGQNQGSSVLDVGGGHGQLAIPLASSGYKVTVLGSNSFAFDQVKGVAPSLNIELKTGSLLELPFPDKSFDFVICFRILSHMSQWELLMSEMCRIARQGVIVDYPTTKSANLFVPALFSVKKGIEKNTRQYRLFKDREIYSAFEKNGFRVATRKPQFFLPMVLHRIGKLPRLSRQLEHYAKIFGLTKTLGSPIILRADRV